MTAIFYYHSIGQTPLSVSVSGFRRHLRQIQQANKRAVSISHLLAATEEERQGMVAITFDDCFLDIYKNAFPVLLEFGFSATFYAVPGYDDITLWGSAAAGRWSEKKEKGFDIPFNFMGENERKHVAASGMEIGCHTMSHPNLDTLAPALQRNEIMKAKNKLESEISQPIKSFCYPRGRYNDDTRHILEECGFSSACSTRRGYFKGNENKFEIPRFGVGDNAEIFASILQGKGGSLSIRRRLWGKLKRTSLKILQKR